LITRDDERANKPLAPLTLSFLGVVIGIVAGFGAVAFRGLIAFFHNALFLGRLSFVYDATIHTAASPWGPWVILVPVAGSVGVVFLVKNFAAEAKGQGVAEVMDAIYYNNGIIRPVVAFVKSFASSLCIGSGGSAGREGPIIQIGSSLGSTLGQIIRMPVWQRITLIAAGAAGGVAATFNTPIGGLLFAVEIMLHEISVRTLVPVGIAAAAATSIGRIFFGSHASFVIPELERPHFHLDNPLLLLAFIGLGAVAGVVSALYIKSNYALEDFFEGRIRNPYLRHMMGMLCVGVIMYLLLITLGKYYIQGVGYSTVQDVLSGGIPQMHLLLLLFALKLLATSMTIGSGGSGGIFSPSLYMGAVLGAAYGATLEHIFPGLGIGVPVFAVAGMAGIFAGASGAAMTSIVMIFEMTLDYELILPMTLTATLSYGIRTLLSTESIYTLKLARRGHWIAEACQVNVGYMKRAREVMDKRFRIVPANTGITEIVADEKPAEVPWFLAEDSRRIVGLAKREDIVRAKQSSKTPVTLVEIANRDFLLVEEESSLFDLITRLRSSHSSVALVLAGSAPAPDKVKGVITSETIIESVLEGLDLFS
jgi:CIC family chloride channel protein